MELSKEVCSSSQYQSMEGNYGVEPLLKMKKLLQWHPKKNNQVITWNKLAQVNVS